MSRSFGEGQDQDLIHKEKQIYGFMYNNSSLSFHRKRRVTEKNLKECLHSRCKSQRRGKEKKPQRNFYF